MKKACTIVAALSVLALSAALSGCGAAKQADGAAQTPSVKTFTLSAVSGGLTGKVAVNETVEIYSKLAGRIASIPVEEGDKVKKGDVLVQLETADLEIQVKKAQAGLKAAQAKLADTLAGARKEDVQTAQSNLEAAQAAADQAKANLELVQITYNQTQNRYDKGEVSKDELNKATTNYKTAKAAYDSAVANVVSAKANLDLLKAGATANTIEQLRANVEASQADLDAAMLALQNASVVSPIDGVVAKKYMKEGEMAFTSMPSGTSILQLVSLDPAKIEVSVPETKIRQLKEGDVLDVQVPSLPDKKLEGTVSYISPVSDPNNNTFTVKLNVPNPDNLLRAGNVVVVNFAGDSAKRIEIPKAALLDKNGKTVLYKLDGDHVKEIAVTAEAKNQDWVYIKNDSGLKSEDKIVLSPPAYLSDNAKVNVE